VGYDKAGTVDTVTGFSPYEHRKVSHLPHYPVCSQKQYIYIPGMVKGGRRRDFGLSGLSIFPYPVGLFPVIHTEEESPVAGFCVGKGDGIPIEADSDGRDSDDRFFEELESGLYDTMFPAVGPDILPALLETGPL
jgi:hypothetical protein